MKEHFEKILGPGGASENPNDLEAYSIDGSELPGKARAILFPHTEEHLRLILSYCNRSNLDLVIRGNGSNNTGMTVPSNSLVLSTQHFDRIHAINVGEQWVNVDCGVTVAELNDALKMQGFRFPLETSSKRLNTIGGLLARNGASRHSLKYGRAVQNVLSIELMDGTGKYFTVTKDFADYLGNEGSIFIFIRAKLKIVPLKEHSADITYFDTLPEAIEHIHALVEKKPLAIEFFDSITATYMGLNTKHAVMVEWEHDLGQYKYETYASLMLKREHARRSLGNQGYILIEDSEVSQEKLLEAIDWCLRHELPVVAHAGLGIVHPFFKREQENIREDWCAWLVENDCKVAGQFGYGLRKKKHVPASLKQKIRQLKERYDYNNILARGKLYDYI